MIEVSAPPHDTSDRRSRSGAADSWVGYVFRPPGTAYFLLLVLLLAVVVVLAERDVAFWSIALFASPISWTFQEYWAHRALMHGPIEPIHKSHDGHHRWPTDQRRVFIPMVFTVVFALGNLFVANCLFGPRVAAANLVGNGLSYFVFEWAHWVCHTERATQGALVRRIRRHHLGHHHHASNNFGFTSPAWDFIFGTLAPELAPRGVVSTFLHIVPLPLVPFLFA